MTHIFGYFRVSSDQTPGRPEPDKRLDKVQYGDTTSTSKLMLTIVSAFNEFERIIVIERQREGIELAKDSRIIGISRTSACRYLECGKSKE